MHSVIKFNDREPKTGERKISYSQYSMYEQCPRHWELAYVKGLRTFKQSIHTLFGTAFHETLQHYLTIMYTETAKKADEIDIEAMLLSRMQTLYKEAVTKMDEHFSTKFELTEFFQDGVTILQYIKRHRGKYFSAKHEELIGIEVRVYHPVSEKNPNVLMLGYLDVVIRDKRTDEITIIDIKTSTMGWNKYQKADKLKLSQLVLYKEYYAKQYGWNVDKIKIKFLIVKRKLIEGAMFPQRRVQEVIPASGKPTRNALLRSIDNWVETCFTSTGDYITDKTYPAVAGKNKRNCKYCEFVDQEDLCPLANRIKE